MLWNQRESQFKMHLRITTGLTLSPPATAYGFMVTVCCWYVKTVSKHRLEGTYTKTKVLCNWGPGPEVDLLTGVPPWLHEHFAPVRDSGKRFHWGTKALLDIREIIIAKVLTIDKVQLNQEIVWDSYVLVIWILFM